MQSARSGSYAVGDFRIPDSGKGGWYPENKAWMFDLDTQTWTRLPDMPTPHHGFATAAIGKRIYAVSGVNNAGGAGTLSMVNFTEVFEP